MTRWVFPYVCLVILLFSSSSVLLADEYHGDPNLAGLELGRAWDPMNPSSGSYEFLAVKNPNSKKVDSNSAGSTTVKIKYVSSHESLIEAMNMNITAKLGGALLGGGSVENDFSFSNNKNFSQNQVSLVATISTEYETSTLNDPTTSSEYVGWKSYRRFLSNPQQELFRSWDELDNDDFADKFSEHFGSPSAEFVNRIKKGSIFSIVLTFSTSEVSHSSLFRNSTSVDYSTALTTANVNAQIAKDFASAKQEGSLSIQVFQQGGRIDGQLTQSARRALADVSLNSMTEPLLRFAAEVQKQLASGPHATLEYRTAPIILLFGKAPSQFIASSPAQIRRDYLPRYLALLEEERRLRDFTSSYPEAFEVIREDAEDHRQLLVATFDDGTTDGELIAMTNAILQNERQKGVQVTSFRKLGVHYENPKFPVPPDWLGARYLVPAWHGVEYTGVDRIGNRYYGTDYSFVQAKYQLDGLKLGPFHSAVVDFRLISDEIQFGGGAERRFTTFQQLLNQRGLWIKVVMEDPMGQEEVVRSEGGTFPAGPVKMDESGNIQMEVRKDLKAISVIIDTSNIVPRIDDGDLWSFWPDASRHLAVVEITGVQDPVQ